MKKSILFISIAALAACSDSNGCGSQVVDFPEELNEAGGDVGGAGGVDNSGGYGGSDLCQDELCPGGQICIDNICTPVNPCQNVVCPPGTQCDLGVCVDLCQDVECPDNEHCENGQCVPENPCQDVLCKEDEVCTGGECIKTDPCDGVLCPEGKECIDCACVCDGDDGDQCANGKVAICHYPPGNPANKHTKCIPQPAIQAHLDHGDKLGACPE